MDGIINVYKERGFTSFDTVAVLRGILKERKIGHAGTLDPDAEGVLVVCTGQATKLVDQLTAHTKEYEAVLRLGVMTDTQDLTGNILETREVSVSEEDVRKAAESFIGEISQIPPMYSAVQVDGKRLYDLARAGKTVERKPRQVRIEAIEILKIDLPEVTMRVKCSKGTYIRTLCSDIGDALGCGGAMASLIRLRSGDFRVEDAWHLDALRDEMHRIKEGETPAFLKPVDACYASFREIRTRGRNAYLARNGNLFRLKKEDASDGESFRVYLPEGSFAGVFRYSKAEEKMKPYKMFVTCPQNPPGSGKRTGKTDGDHRDT